MKMKTMKMMMGSQLVLVLVLNGVLSVSAYALHQDTGITGCSDIDAEDMYGLDGEEISYFDYIKKKVFEPQPDFINPHIHYPTQSEQAPGFLVQCRSDLKIIREATHNPPLKLDAPSTPMIYIRDHMELGVKNTLICHVSGFYPAPVRVHWTHNGLNSSGAALTVPYPNQEGTFTQISRLDITPQQGDIYSCTVQHAALTQDLTQMWNVDVPQPSVGPAVFCGVGLTMGLLGVATGTFFLIKGNECS